MTGEVKGSMTIPYNKLFKLLIEKNMEEKGLQEKADAISGTIVTTGHNEPVSADLTGRVCSAPGCTAWDGAEFFPDELRAAA